MKIGELIDKMFIDKLEVPAKCSDGSEVSIRLFNVVLHGNGALKDFEVQNIHVSPCGVFVTAEVAERSA